MRRGLMDHDEAEVPAALLAGRVARLAAACEARGLAGVLLHTNFTRPAAVSMLTHFVPFWSQGLLLVTAGARSVLFMATTGRTVQWIRQTSVVDEVVVSASVGASAAEWIARQGAAVPPRHGFMDMDSAPAAVLAALRKGLPALQLEEAAPWIEPLAASFGPTPGVEQRAREIAHEAMQAVFGNHGGQAPALVAAVEGAARRGGAEEAYVSIAPDLAREAEPVRLEGPAPLGRRFAVQLALAYKGHWLRVARSYEHEGGEVEELAASGNGLRALAEGRAAGLPTERLVAAFAQGARAEVEDWWLEAVRGNLPLATVAGPSEAVPDGAPPAASSLGLRLRDASGPWILSEPL